MLLAGDIGATKALLGLFSPAPERPDPVHTRTFSTAAHDGLETIVEEFLAALPGGRPRIDAASFGVAGPIVEQVAELTNVSWQVDAASVKERFSVPRVTLLNDLEAMAYSVPALRPEELVVLQEGRRVPTGNAALIAAGTGLGEALLHNIGGRFVPSPTEAGHTDFAARTPEEIDLLVDLTRAFGRVDVERVLSGPGLVNVHRHFHPDGCPECGPEVGQAPAPAIISRSALDGRCSRCVRSLRLFVGVYGAEAGNLALRSVASAGVFVSGGIAPKILPALQTGLFLEAFRAKGPMTEFLSQVPVAVVLNDRSGLLGAAVHANAASRGET